MRRVVLCFWLLFAFFSNLSAQTADTINLAQQLQQEGKYKEGAKLLKVFLIDHPGDFQAKRLYALLLYWSGDFETANSFYQKVIDQFPDQGILKLEYGRMLYESNKLGESRKQLRDYLSTDPENVEVHLKLGWIAYWNGEYKEAQNQIDVILNQYPDNPDAKALKEKIRELHAPWLEIKDDYIHDSQPLDVLGPTLQAGWFQSRFFEPQITFATKHFYDNTDWLSSYWIQFANTMSFVKPGIYTTLKAGLYRHTTQTNHWTGEVEFTKACKKFLKLTASVVRAPYDLTQRSIQESVMMNSYTVSAGWADLSTFNGLAAFNIQQFEDDNYIKTFYAWLFAPPIKASVFVIRFGCAYNFSDAEKNNYASVKDLSDILAEYDPDNEIEGIYDAYFTPNHQHIVSALAALQIKPVQKFQINLNANIGAFSRAEIPYLFLDNDESGEIFIDKDYFEETKVTMDLKAEFRYSPSTKVTLQAGYQYFKTFFCRSHLATLSCKFIRLNDKK